MDVDDKQTVIAKFCDETGDFGNFPQLELPLDITPDQLAEVLVRKSFR